MSVPYRALLCLVAQGSLGAAQEASRVTVEVLEASPGWTCPTLDTDLRAFERRVRITLLWQQQPHAIYTSPPGAPPGKKGALVPEEDQRLAWASWSRPVVLTLLLRPRATHPPETPLTDPDGYSDTTVAVSSGAVHVDSGAMFAAAASGGRPVLQGVCQRNFWKLRLSFYPPSVPDDQRVIALMSYLDDPDPWARYLAACDLLSLGEHSEDAKTALQALLSDSDERLKGAARSATADCVAR